MTLRRSRLQQLFPRFIGAENAICLSGAKAFVLTVEVAHLLSSLVVACRDSLLRTTRLTLPPKLTGLLWLSSSKP